VQHHPTTSPTEAAHCDPSISYIPMTGAKEAEKGGIMSEKCPGPRVSSKKGKGCG
jgi:hypothetical protein